MSDVGKIDYSTDFANYDIELPEDLPIVGNSHYLLVYPIAFEAQTQGGLMLPDTVVDSVEKLTTVGLVVAKGAMCYKTAMCQDPDTKQYLHWCEVGDWVLFSRMSQAYSIAHAGKKFWILPDTNILCKISDPKYVNPNYKVAGALNA